VLPDIGEAERGRRVAQDVLADALLFGPVGLGRGRAVGVRDDDALDRGRGDDALDANSVSSLGIWSR
jgi:hypothetical protein